MATLRAIWIAAASLVAMALVAEAFTPAAPLQQPVAALPIPAKNPTSPPSVMADSVQIRMGTYLGNWERNYYGNRAPDTLAVIWKHNLGSGETYISKAVGTKEWKGAGWTGQPLMVRESGKDYLLQGAYDHHLKKIDAATGALVWQCEFDDVLKGTGTLWSNPHSRNPEDRHIILQGSRMGSKKTIYSARTTSFRGVSLASGKVLWEMNVRKGDSYSRDVDASALILRDTAYIGLENGLFTVLDPRPEATWLLEGLLQPHVHQQLPLYDEQDIRHHRGNLVVEASPCLLRDHIYVSAGSGHVYGYNLKTRELDWDFYVGSDLDGTPVVTADSCLLVTVEQQYIPGKGGVLKLNPQRPPEDAVEWFLPTASKRIASWRGGVIGSATVNSRYTSKEGPLLAAFIGIDGYLYVVDQLEKQYISKTLGPDNQTLYPMPKVHFRTYVGPSISTPIFVGNRLVAATYRGLFLFSYNDSLQFTRLDHFREEFESTPVALDARVYVASRNGYLYCLGAPTPAD